ncbi:MAG: MFS transporter, partial [Dehalococcoidia bacterium]|nr:MFS transporter [Dehalococcoidia bacterium]
MATEAPPTEDRRGAPDEERRRDWRRTFLALKERDFAVYFSGDMGFFMAMQMNLILRGYLAVELTGQATAIGIVSLGQGIPMLMIAPIGGVLADRMNKRTLLTIMQTFVAGVNLVLAVLIFADLLEFWHLVLGAVGAGTAIATVMPARQAVVPQL